MFRKDYHIAIRGVTPIQFSHRHNTPKEKGESADSLERRTYMSKAEYDGDHVILSADRLTTMLVAGAVKLGMPWEKRKTFGKVFMGGLQCFPAKIGQRSELVANEVDCSSTGKSSLTGNPGPMVVRVFPMLHQWSGTYRVAVFRPEINVDVLREHAEFAHMFIGLGAFRPQNGRNFGRAEVVSVEEVKTVTA